jgi:hypothetical protein
MKYVLAVSGKRKKATDGVEQKVVLPVREKHLK